MSRKVALSIAGLMALFVMGLMIPLLWVMEAGIDHEAYVIFLFLVGISVVTAVVVLVGGYFDLTDKSRLVRKTVPVLEGLVGLTEAGTQGYDFVCRVQSPDPAVPPLTLRVPMFYEETGFRLEVPWELPADIVVLSQTTYSDLPGLMVGLQDLRRGFSDGERLWTNIEKGRLESLVKPRWGLRRKPDERPESVRDRILDRWRRMESIRLKAMTEERFAPELSRDNPQQGWGPFWPSVWCPRCRKIRWVWTEEGPEHCWRCRTRLIRLLHRVSVWSSRNDTRWKMEQVHARYRL